MTQQQLATATGLVYGTIENIELARTAIDVEYLVRIARATGVTVGELIAPLDETLVIYNPDGQPAAVTNVTESNAHHAGLGPHVIAELAAREDSGESG